MWLGRGIYRVEEFSERFFGGVNVFCFVFLFVKGGCWRKVRIYKVLSRIRVEGKDF